MAGQHPGPVGVLGRPVHRREVLAGGEQLVPLQAAQDLVCSDRAGQLMVALAARRGSQQVVDQHTLGIAEDAEPEPRPWRGSGRKVAPLRTGLVAQVRVPGGAELALIQAVEERPRGDRHLPAAARGGGNVATSPRPGLRECRPWPRSGEPGHTEAKRGQSDRARRAPAQESSPAGDLCEGSRQ